MATDSLTAKAKGINNEPDATQKVALIETANNILEPLINLIGKIPVINSFFRSAELNQAVGGGKNSQHVKGQAVDLEGLGEISNKELFEIIQKNLLFDQLIWEFGNQYNPDWVHVSYRPGNNRGEVLRSVKKNGKTAYEFFTLFFAIAGILFLMGCNPTKQTCDRLYPPTINERIVIDSVITHKSDTTFKTDTFYIHLVQQGQTVYKNIEVPKYIVFPTDTVTAGTSLAIAKAWFEGHKLILTCNNKDTTIFISRDSVTAVINTYKERLRYEKTRVTDMKVENTKFAGFTIWFFWIVIALVAGFVGAKLLKLYAKI